MREVEFTSKLAADKKKAATKGAKKAAEKAAEKAADASLEKAPEKAAVKSSDDWKYELVKAVQPTDIDEKYEADRAEAYATMSGDQAAVIQAGELLGMDEEEKAKLGNAIEESKKLGLSLETYLTLTASKRAADQLTLATEMAAKKTAKAVTTSAQNQIAAKAISKASEAIVAAITNPANLTSGNLKAGATADELVYTASRWRTMLKAMHDAVIAGAAAPPPFLAALSYLSTGRPTLLIALVMSPTKLLAGGRYPGAADNTEVAVNSLIRGLAKAGITSESSQFNITAGAMKKYVPSYLKEYGTIKMREALAMAARKERSELRAVPSDEPEAPAPVPLDGPAEPPAAIPPGGPSEPPADIPLDAALSSVIDHWNMMERHSYSGPYLSSVGGLRGTPADEPPQEGGSLGRRRRAGKAPDRSNYLPMAKTIEALSALKEVADADLPEAVKVFSTLVFDGRLQKTPAQEFERWVNKKIEVHAAAVGSARPPRVRFVYEHWGA